MALTKLFSSIIGRDPWCACSTDWPQPTSLALFCFKWFAVRNYFLAVGREPFLICEKIKKSKD